MRTQKLKQIEHLAAKVRKEVKKMAKVANPHFFIDHHDLGGTCGIASYLLHEVLTANGIKSQLIYGECHGCSHFWVKVGTTIVDITHTQFEVNVPEVAIFDKNHKNYSNLKPEKFYTRHAKRELFSWDSYKRFKRRLDNAKSRLLKGL